VAPNRTKENNSWEEKSRVRGGVVKKNPTAEKQKKKATKKGSNTGSIVGWVGVPPETSV